MNHDRLATLRILDANANRASEGLRVVEEYLRFVLGDRHLTELCKQLRHELATVLADIPAHELSAARDTLGDVGTITTATGEFVRGAPRDVAIASQKRVEQSLRSLEEFAKPSYPNVAAAVESLRYRAYTLAKATDSTARSRARLARARLYVLIDGRENEAAFARLVDDLVGTGVDLLQFRDKKLSDRDLLGRARKLRELTRGTQSLFIMNDRPDLALLSDADGVHVGQDELRIADARAIVGVDRLVGVSTHAMDQARAAVLDGADYIGCGPTFHSETKPFLEYPGLKYLREVAAEITLPAFAIGGITAANLPDIFATGMQRVAVSGGVTRSSNPAGATRHLRDLLLANDFDSA